VNCVKCGKWTILLTQIFSFFSDSFSYTAKLLSLFIRVSSFLLSPASRYFPSLDGSWFLGSLAQNDTRGPRRVWTRVHLCTPVYARAKLRPRYSDAAHVAARARVLEIPNSPTAFRTGGHVILLCMCDLCKSYFIVELQIRIRREFPPILFPTDYSVGIIARHRST